MEKWLLPLYRGVWMQSLSQEWWDYDMNGFKEENFLQNFRMSTASFTSLNARHFKWTRDVKVKQIQMWLFRLKLHKKFDLYLI